jgi:hypothetical protein
LKSEPAPAKSTTQNHLDIKEIADDLVLLKNGYVCLILQTTTINFGLLSETEQDAIIYAYAGFLNSLTFPIQILVRSQKKDVTGYIKSLVKRENNIKNPELKKRVNTYRKFVEYIVREKKILDKKFYIIIPFSPSEAGVNSAKIFTRSQDISPKDKAWLLEKAVNALNPKKSHVIAQMSKIGLKIKQLNTEELIRLFFSIYNPETVGQTLLGPEDYQSLAVHPNVSNHTAEGEQKS